MPIFSDQAAKDFVSLYNTRSKPSIDDIDTYFTNEIDNRRKIFTDTDGTLQPIAYLLLKEAESSYYLALSNFVRGLEILGTGLGNWAHVTFYYSCFYSAKSILSLHGGWGKDYARKYWVSQVDLASQNKLKLIEWKHNGNKINSHRAFWSYYYASMRNIINTVPSQYSPALSPINNDVFWMTKTRNNLNYKINDALKINSNVLLNLDENNFPYCLPQEIANQYNQAKNLIAFTNYLLEYFNINTDAFNCISSGKNRNDVLREYLYERDYTDLDNFNLKSDICATYP